MCNNNIELFATLETTDPETAVKVMRPLCKSLGCPVGLELDDNFNADRSARVSVDYIDDPANLEEGEKLFDMFIDIEPQHLDIVLDYFDAHAEDFIPVLVDVFLPIDDGADHTFCIPANEMKHAVPVMVEFRDLMCKYTR